jgi:hypothetical protein
MQRARRLVAQVCAGLRQGEGADDVIDEDERAPLDAVQAEAEALYAQIKPAWEGGGAGEELVLARGLGGGAERRGLVPVQKLAKKSPKPNEPCPCGSGKKWKKCCKT